VFPDGDGLPVQLSALRFGGGSPATVTGLPAVPDGHLIRASGPAADGPWELTITSPADGPWLLVRALSHGTGPAATWLVGTESTARSSVSVLAVDPTFERPAPALQQAAATPGRRPGTGAIALKLPTRLDLDTITRISPLYACSPIDVSYAAILLTGAHRPGPGKSVVTGDQVVFGTPDGAEVDPSRALALLDPDRRCDRYSDERVPGGADKRPFLRRSRAEARWLYPGDRATFRTALVGLHAAAGVIEVQGFSYGQATTSLTVRVADEVLATSDLALDGSTVTVPLARHVAPHESVDVEVRSDGFVQVVRLRLVEPAP
jgi:hypothetical protein